MNDIAYVQCHSRLQQKTQISTRNYDPICLEDIGKFAEDWIFEDDPQVLNGEEIGVYRKNLESDDTEIHNSMAMNNEAQWIDEDYDIDASQETDEANMPAADEDQIVGVQDQDIGDGRDEDEDRVGNVTDWTYNSNIAEFVALFDWTYQFQYR